MKQQITAEDLDRIVRPLGAPDPRFRHRIARLEIAPSARPPALRPLCVEDERMAPEWLIRAHRASAPGRSSPVSCYFLTDVVISGSGFVNIDNALVVSEDIMPYHVRSLIACGGIDLAAFENLPLRVIDEPVIVYAGWGTTIYGHVLTELIPRLHIAEVRLRRRLGRPRILVQAPMPAWHLAILQQLFGLSADDFILFNVYAERIHLRRAIFPSLIGSQDGFLPYFSEVVSTIRKRIDTDGKQLVMPRLFISRAIFEDGWARNRRFENGLEIAGIACREYGFTILAPETIPWPTQVRLFAQAEAVAGEFGSGLHSAIFSPAGTRVASIGLGNMVQSFIGALFGHDNAYIKTEGDLASQFSVDKDLFREFMDKTFSRWRSGRDKAVGSSRFRTCLKIVDSMRGRFLRVRR
jgi:capsular polysaccharide biosynthesis protein